MLSRTSGLAAASAWMACRRPSSDGDGVYVAGVSTGMAAGSPSPRPLPDPGLWAAWIVVQEQQIRELSVWACGAGQQRVHDPRPSSKSSPNLSIGTSHFEPRGQSREGFDVGLLRSR